MSINKYDSTTGDLIPIHSGEVMYADSPIGTILSYGGTTAPNGFLLCNGAAVSRTTYSDLFAVIGTSYGAGDGSTTFNVPNLQGKVAVGYSSGEIEFNSIGKADGEKTHTLTYYEMPQHAHSALYIGSSAGSELGWTGINGTVNGSVQTSVAGGNQAHNNLQPYVVTNYIIKAKQTPMPADMQGEVDDINGEITQIKSDLSNIPYTTYDIETGVTANSVSVEQIGKIVIVNGTFTVASVVADTPVDLMSKLPKALNIGFFSTNGGYRNQGQTGTGYIGYSAEKNGILRLIPKTTGSDAQYYITLIYIKE